MDIGDTVSLIFWQYSIPILLSSGALVKSVNINITVTERVKIRTVSKVDTATVRPTHKHYATVNYSDFAISR